MRIPSVPTLVGLALALALASILVGGAPLTTLTLGTVLATLGLLVFTVAAVKAGAGVLLP